MKTHNVEMLKNALSQLQARSDIEQVDGTGTIRLALQNGIYDCERAAKDAENLKNAEDQARAQVQSICEMVAAVECDYSRLEELLDERKNSRLIMWNMAGYLPDMEPFVVSDSFDGREALAVEMEERADQIEESAELQSEDDNGRDDSDEVRSDITEMRKLREVAAQLRISDCEEFSETIGHINYSMSADVDRLADEDDTEELAELESQAGDCTDEDDARERLQEDPLSVEVRSGWCSPGETASTEEFTILLCTGGPAVRIMGELDEHNQPCRARVEYQDWFTPWTELVDITSSDRSAILTYCQSFYFGE